MNKTYMKRAAVIWCLCFMAILYTGCSNGNDNAADESSSTKTEQEGTGNSGVSGDTGTDTDGGADGSSDIGEDIGNAAEDIADGVGDAADDLAGIDYSDYDDAHDYLMGQIGTKGQNNYEVRNEDREAKNYDSSDSSKKGYRYEIYDTSSEDGEKYGVFYVDQETGKIYREKDGNGVEEYKGN
ncbi:MAG: ubiquinone biosynthesis protein [Lachnospiraceae bacterium]|nr:ubiquinone biosynthesis protein [Lachnospiraceae bacterium]